MSGGVEWEQGQAVTRMVQALIAGDHAKDIHIIKHSHLFGFLDSQKSA